MRTRDKVNERIDQEAVAILVELEKPENHDLRDIIRDYDGRSWLGLVRPKHPVYPDWLEPYVDMPFAMSSEQSRRWETIEERFNSWWSGGVFSTVMNIIQSRLNA